MPIISAPSTAVWMGVDSVVSSDSLRFDLVDRILLVVHADMPPADDDWTRLSMVRDANRDKIHATLVIAPPRARLSSAQRADVAQFMKETNTGAVVVTASALVRGVANAISFLGVKVRAFAPAEMASALEFLVVPPSRRADLLRRIEVLKAHLVSSARDSATHKIA